MTNAIRRDGYHHGQLRRVLLDTALELASTRGLQEFTLREVARRAGVSHAAPYHHFPDKEALLAALSAEIFTDFGAALRTAWETTPGTAIVRLDAVGRAYIHFALTHPAAFRLMFRPELHMAGQEDPELREVGERAFRVLVDGIVAAQAEGFIAPGDPILPALAAWSMAHGLASLLLEGAAIPSHAPLDDLSLNPLIETVLKTLQQGLLTRTPAAQEELPTAR